MKFIVETSARHIHVTKETLAILYGEGHELTNKKDLSQPGQFACEEKVKLIGPKGELNVSILGPVRKASQVEISMTETRTLGIAAPVRESGDLEGTPGVTLVGPCGEVELEKGLIVAKRHVHLTPADAEKFGVENGETVLLKIPSEGRALVFDDVVVRVSDKFAPAAHLDTDEANAAGIKGSIMGEIIKK